MVRGAVRKASLVLFWFFMYLWHKMNLGEIPHQRFSMLTWASVIDVSCLADLAVWLPETTLNDTKITMRADTNQDPKLKILQEAEELIAELESANNVQTKISLNKVRLIYVLVGLLFVGFVVQNFILGKSYQFSNIWVPGSAVLMLFLGGYFISKKKNVGPRDALFLAILNLVVYLVSVFFNKSLPINLLPALIIFLSILTTAGSSLILSGVAIVVSGFVLYHPVYGVDVTIAARILVASLILLVVFQLYIRNFQRLVSVTLNVTSGLKRMTETLSEDLVTTTLERNTARELDFETGLLNEKSFIKKINGFLSYRSASAPLVFVRFEILQAAESLRGMSERSYLELLHKVTLKITEFCAQGSVSRPSKWEFILVCEIGPSEEVFKDNLSILVYELKQILRNTEANFSNKLRAGVATWPADGQSLDDVLSATEIALIHAHQNNVTQPVWYELSMRYQINERRQLAERIAPGINADEFYFDYQPVVKKDLKSVEFYECLIRWNHPTLGIFNPSKFISLAIDYGQIIPLTMWSLRKAAQILKSKNEFLEAEVRLSVNVAPSFIGWVLKNPQKSRDFLDGVDFKRGTIILEITEESFLESSEEVVVLFESLKERGFLIALDDFGAGFSSLSKVATLPLDYLKMDMSLVSGIERLEKKQKTYEAMSQLGYQLGIKVVSEGVETQAELEIVSKMTVDFIQGYVIARPHSESEIGKPLGIQ